MGRKTTLLLLLPLLAYGCDEAPAEPDAGPAVIDAGTDAGGPFDPSANLEAFATEGTGPWALWGFQVATIDQSHAVVIGGTDYGAGSTVFDTAWRVEITADGLRATEVGSSGPPPGYCACATYDAARDRVVVFGGRDLMVNAFAPATWELDLSTDTWTEISGATQPTGTLGCSMAYLPSNETVYMFGGANGSGANAETYRYDGAAWTRIDAAGPVARYDAELLADHDGDSLLLFGGSYGASGAAFYSDLWRFDPASDMWSEVALPEGPPGRRTPWVVRDPDHEGLYVGFGFDGSMQPIGDLYYADLETLTWTEIPVAADGPGPRGFSHALPGGTGGLGVLIGGFSGTRPASDSWRLVR